MNENEPQGMNARNLVHNARAGMAWLGGAWLLVRVSALASAPSFPEVDSEPLGNVTPAALVLHEGWQMRESVLAGNDGQAISRPGFDAAKWYRTRRG